MSTTKERIMKVAKEALSRNHTMCTVRIAECVNNKTRDGVSTQRMHNLLRLATDIERVPETSEPVEWRLKGNLDATEDSGRE